MVHESTNHEADRSEGLGVRVMVRVRVTVYYFLNARCYLVDTCNFLWHSVLSCLHLIHTVTPIRCSQYCPYALVENDFLLTAHMIY